MEQRKSALVDIGEIVECYLNVSKKKARKIVKKYLKPRMIGNRMYVERAKLEELLLISDFPLEV